MLYQPACHTAPKREMPTLGDQGIANLSESLPSLSIF
jgi:hypothetical protein